MKSFSKLKGISFLSNLLLLMLSYTTSRSAITPQISSIGIDNFTKTTRLYLSGFGGSRIFIHGLGFDDHSFKNEVYLQHKENTALYPNIECVIDNLLSSDKLIVCDLLEGYYQTIYLLHLKVNGEHVECPTYKCEIHFDFTNVSGNVKAIWPQQVSHGSFVNIIGVFSNPTKSGKKILKFQNSYCSISEESISRQDNMKLYKIFVDYYLRCKIPDDIPIGGYVSKILDSYINGYMFNSSNSFFTIYLAIMSHIKSKNIQRL
jgi:hypothetical protein